MFWIWVVVGSVSALCRLLCLWGGQVLFVCKCPCPGWQLWSLSLLCLWWWVVLGCWGILESGLGVFFRSLSIAFCLSVVLRLFLVLWTKSVNSCLSLSNSVQFFVSCVISVLIRAEFSSILLTNSLLVLIAAESRESATSFSAFHHAWLPTGHAFDLHCCVCANADVLPLQKCCQDCHRFLPLFWHPDGWKSSLQLFLHTVRNRL